MAAKYKVVKEGIKSSIISGKFQVNEKIDSESELMRLHNVSRHTVRKAVEDLVRDGWLFKKQGAGTFCAERDTLPFSPPLNGKNIAVITTYFSDYIFPSIIRGIEKHLSESGYQMTVFSTNNDLDQERRCLESVISQQFDGLIIEPTKSALPNPNINYYLDLERLNIPYLMINAYYEELEPPHLIADDFEGGYLQAEHLLNLNHRGIIGFFKNDDAQGSKRMKGFIQAHRDKKIPVKPDSIIAYSTEDKNVKPMIELKERLKSISSVPTAIVCYNDELALKLLDALREHKLTVPDDISIIGFDDSILSLASEVKFTTISHPKEKMGLQAAELIHQMIINKNKVKLTVMESVTYKTKLIIRNSTAPYASKVNTSIQSI
ncbi:GntR family transcriptional regulator [Alkalicoccus daliensis]|uniref:Transcriptional regulator, GntR family n=1 Tax=Alkalicoccus daliensis TaxID=745820 RepID=A0A1H0DNI5_9BACI|nr:GntR family transcriptional regulator [Alkalicoccus daliensis]SDN71714.1 transcriptional regulator, GntR family [Alkalicoccus daliensis]